MQIPENVEVNGKLFSIKKLLGKGKGGYSYLAEKDGKKYTLKQIHHEPCDYFQFGNKIEAEARDYKRLVEAGVNVPELYEIDFEKEIVLKEFIDGADIVSLVKNGGMKPEYLSQAREMAEKINGKGLNLDYYPTNFIVQDEKLFYIDYECSEYSDEWNFENWGKKYWSKTEEFKNSFCKDE